MQPFTPKDIEARIRMAFAENEVLGKDNAHRSEQIAQTLKLIAFWQTQLELAKEVTA